MIFFLLLLLIFPKLKLQILTPFLNKQILKTQLDLTLFPPKLVKISANVIGKHLSNIINVDIENYNVPDNTKAATVRPIYKKKSRNELENYIPASLFNTFSKIYERYVHNLITLFC